MSELSFHKTHDLNELIQILSMDLKSVLKKNPRMVLSGGSVLKMVPGLIQSGCLPTGLKVYELDERLVPPDHESSNQGQMQKLFKKNAELVCFDVSLKHDECAKEYAKKLPEETPMFHSVILGAGPDGHIASLFPGSDAIQSKNLTEATVTDTFEIHERVTLAPEAILNSKRIDLILMGKSKSPLIPILLSESETKENYPLLLLKEHKNLHVWYVD
jgi:6-phosphogluconolactonase